MVLLFIILGVVAFREYLNSSVVVHTVSLPKYVEEWGYDAEGMTRSALADIPRFVENVKTNQKYRSIGLPNEDGTCFDGLEPNGLLMRVEVPGPDSVYSMDDFPKIDIFGEGYSIVSLSHRIGKIFGVQRVELRPRIYTNANGDLFFRVDWRKGNDAHVSGRERRLLQISDAEVALREELAIAMRPAIFGLMSTEKREEDFLVYLQAARGIYEDDIQALLLSISYLESLRFDPAVDEGRLTIGLQSFARQVVEDMYSSGQYDVSLEGQILLAFALDVIDDRYYSADSSKGSFALTEFEDQVISDVQTYLRRPDVPEHARIALEYSLQAIKSGSPLGSAEKALSDIESGDVPNFEVSQMAINLSLLAAQNGNLALSQRFSEAAIQRDDFEWLEKRNGARYHRAVQHAILDLVRGDPDVALIALDRSEFRTYPCTGFQLLSALQDSKYFDEMYVSKFASLERAGLKNFHLYNSWGTALAQLGEHKAAIEKFEIARDYDGNMAWALLNEAGSSAAIGDYDRATQLFQASLDEALVPQAVNGWLNVLSIMNDGDTFLKVFDRYEALLRVDEGMRDKHATSAAKYACMLGVPFSRKLSNYEKYHNGGYFPTCMSLQLSSP